MALTSTPRPTRSKRPIPLGVLLTVPFVLLTLMLSVGLGWLSYDASSRAVEAMAERLGRSMVRRIVESIEEQVNWSQSVLDAAFTKDHNPPHVIDDRLDRLQERFWIATGMYTEPYDFVYMANVKGQFFGLKREAGVAGAEVRIQLDPNAPRRFGRIHEMRGAPHAVTTEDKLYRAHERPWWKVAQDAVRDTWTPVYLSFRDPRLVVTRTRPLRDAQGQLVGVVATDLMLSDLEHFLQTLDITPRAFAFVVGGDGQMIASSRSASIAKDAAGQPVRVRAESTQDAEVASVYRQVSARLPAATLRAPGMARVQAADGGRALAAFARLRGVAGMDWGVVVVVPFSDIVSDVQDILKHALWLGSVASGLMLLLGLVVVNAVTREVNRLTRVATQIGDGDLSAEVSSHGTLELAQVAGSIGTLQDKLRTDKLTGLANREALLQRLQRRIEVAQRSPMERGPTFALLFLDLDGFKAVNDQLGHAAGDGVLRETALRLRERIRESDMACRWAGDEFIVMVDHVLGEPDVRAVAAHVEAAIGQPYVCPEHGPLPPLGASIGYAIYPRDGLTADALIRHADAAMYEVKRQRKLDESGFSRPGGAPEQP